MRDETNKTVVLLTTSGRLPTILTNNLADHVDHLVVLSEDFLTSEALLRSRAKLCGKTTAIGQHLAGYLFRVISRLSRSRRLAIERDYGLDSEQRGDIETIPVGSVNSARCKDELRRLDPAVVVVFATRIIKKDILVCIDAPFINIHDGINPKYRGQDPGYWALVQRDRENVGATVHLVDEGVDTGGILYQSRAPLGRWDNIATYQLVQLAPALACLRKAIDDALAGRLSPRSVDLPSQKWFPPTLWAYLWYAAARRVW